MVAPLSAIRPTPWSVRMIVPGEARKGGMPLYKYLGNRVLTRLENQIAGLELSEWHSGYRAYSVAALQELPFQHNSDGFDFDTEVLVQLKEAGKRITEVAIPTYDGEEISRLRGLRYAKDVVVDVSRYRAHKMGFGGELVRDDRVVDDGSTPRIVGSPLAGAVVVRRVLDLVATARSPSGPHAGPRRHRRRRTWHGVAERVDRFVEGDLRGRPPCRGRRATTSSSRPTCSGACEPTAARPLPRRARRADDDRRVPNRPYPRLRVVGGFFDYDQQHPRRRTPPSSRKPA
jgi:hypothetical protein